MADVRARNNVQVTGKGPPLVFAHGFGCDQNVWRRVAPRFEASHTVVCFDYVGAGKADRSAYDSERYGSLRGYARDVTEVCEALGIQGAVLVGHSVSSMIGAWAAVDAPHLFDRIVMLAPSPCFIDGPGYRGGFERKDVEQLLDLMDANFMGWATALSQMALHPPDLARELRESFCISDPRILREFARVTFLSDQREVLPKVPVPCLVVQCSRDDLVPISVGEYTADQLRYGAYRLIEVPGHMPHMSHPDEVETVIRDYLALADPRGAGG